MAQMPAYGTPIWELSGPIRPYWSAQAPAGRPLKYQCLFKKPLVLDRVLCRDPIIFGIQNRASLHQVLILTRHTLSWRFQ